MIESGYLLVGILVGLWHIAVIKSNEDRSGAYEAAYYFLVAEATFLVLFDMQLDLAPLVRLPQMAVKGVFLCCMLAITAGVEVAPKHMPYLVRGSVDPKVATFLFRPMPFPLYVYAIYIAGLMLGLWNSPPVTH